MKVVRSVTSGIPARSRSTSRRWRSAVVPRFIALSIASLAVLERHVDVGQHALGRRASASISSSVTALG